MLIQRLMSPLAVAAMKDEGMVEAELDKELQDALNQVRENPL